MSISDDIRVADAEAAVEEARRARAIAVAVANGAHSQEWLDDPARTPEEIRRALAAGELSHLL